MAATVWSRVDADPDKKAIRSSRGDLTYGELRQRALRVAGAARDAGLRSFDRVVFIAPSILEFPIIYYGLLSLGANVITMNTMATKAEIEYVLDDADAALVVAWHECDGPARTVAEQHKILFWSIEEGAQFDAPALSSTFEYSPDDTSVILYTSGTTGRPKGAELTAANLLSATSALAALLELVEGDGWGTSLPLFHVYGQCVVMNTTLARGATLSLLSPFDADGMLEMMRRDRLTIVSGVPTMWNALLHSTTASSPEDFAELRIAMSGGASMPMEIIREFSKRFECVILEGYALTESTAVGAFNVREGQKVGTVGPAAPGAQLQVRDANGVVLADGSIGEVFLKGPTVMKGYRNRPEETAEAIQDGWLRTGDLGTLDADGYLTIVDRLKDLIIRGGYNVYPREVEEVLHEHPDVVEAAVIGVPDDYYGEEVAAVVALRHGATLTMGDLRAWAKEQLSAYKVPHLVQFVDTLPKGPTGKILKRAIDPEAVRAASGNAS